MGPVAVCLLMPLAATLGVLVAKQQSTPLAHTFLPGQVTISTRSHALGVTTAHLPHNAATMAPLAGTEPLSQLAEPQPNTEKDTTAVPRLIDEGAIEESPSLLWSLLMLPVAALVYTLIKSSAAGVAVDPFDLEVGRSDDNTSGDNNNSSDPWAMAAIFRGPTSPHSSQDTTPNGSHAGSPVGSSPGSPTSLGATAVGRGHTVDMLDQLLGHLEPPTLKIPKKRHPKAPTESKTPFKDRLPEGPYASKTLSRVMQPWGYQPTSHEGWRIQRECLINAHVRPVSAERVNVANSPFVVLDVRNLADFNKQHIAGAHSVLLFRASTDRRMTLRKLVLAGIGGQHVTEENPGFLEDVTRVLPDKAAQIVLVDSSKQGGIEPCEVHKYGYPSRSCLAAYRLVLAGYTNIRYMKGGIDSWMKNGYPLEPTKL